MFNINSAVFTTCFLPGANLLFQSDFNRPFLSCSEPQYESEAKCKAFHMKISFVCL